MPPRKKPADTAAPTPAGRALNAALLVHGAMVAPEDRQRQFALRVQTKPRPCPGCARPVSQVEASGKPLEEWRGEWGERYPFTCPGCGLELAPTLPVVAADAPFTWSAKERG